MKSKRARAVLHVADYGAAYPGNFVASLRALDGPCRARGLRLALAFSRNVEGQPWVEALRADGIAVHLLDRSAGLWARTTALAELTAREDAAILHTHFATYDVAAALAAARSTARLQVIWHAHNGLPAHRPTASAAKDAVKLSVLGRRARLVAVSTAIREEAIAHGFPARRAYHVQNGVDLAHATGATASRADLRARLAIAPGTQVVLAFGWDPLRKGIDLVLEAVGAAASRASVALLVVGGDALHAFVRERCGGSLPRWVRAVHPQERVADLFAAADLLLSASREEGFSYALGEALANGLPAVVSDIPGLAWAHAVEGVRFTRPGDAGALSVALEDILRWAPERRDRFARMARAFAATELSVAAWAGRVLAVYQAALGEPPTRHTAGDWPACDAAAG